MATIVKGKNPQKPYTVRYVHDGRQREKSFALRKDAMDFKVKFEHDSREQTFIDPKMAGEKFGTVARRWLARHPGSPRTLYIYESVLRIHILPAFGSKSLLAVAQDREGVEAFLRQTLPAKGLSSSTIRTCYLVIGGVVNDAIKSGRIRESRLRGIPMPPLNRKAELVFATRDQVQHMAQAMPEQYGATVYLMRGCGLRLGEALGVLGEDVRSGSLRLSRQLEPSGQQAVGLKHRKEGDYRDIPIPQYVLDGLPVNFVGFPGVSHRSYRTWFNRARDDAGLPQDFTPHSLRHQFASVCLAGGVPITDVSKWLGHRDINVTFAIYGHLVPASWDRARAVLDGEWAGE